MKKADNKERQNFLTLPTANFDGFRPLGAEPQDRAALTTKMMRMSACGGKKTPKGLWGGGRGGNATA